jgi:hypothetical protein
MWSFTASSLLVFIPNQTETRGFFLPLRFYVFSAIFVLLQPHALSAQTYPLRPTRTDKLLPVCDGRTGTCVSVGSCGPSRLERERLYCEGGMGKQLCKFPEVLEFAVTVSELFSCVDYLLQGWLFQQLSSLTVVYAEVGSALSSITSVTVLWRTRKSEFNSHCAYLVPSALLQVYTHMCHSSL